MPRLHTSCVLYLSSHLPFPNLLSQFFPFIFYLYLIWNLLSFDPGAILKKNLTKLICEVDLITILDWTKELIKFNCSNQLFAFACCWSMSCCLFLPPPPATSSPHLLSFFAITPLPHNSSIPLCALLDLACLHQKGRRKKKKRKECVTHQQLGFHLETATLTGWLPNQSREQLATGANLSS